MNPETVIALAREGVTVIIMAVLPIVGSGLVVGLLVSIFQATTQIQEPTLSFVPKIIVVLLAVMLFGSYVLSLILEFTFGVWENLGNITF
ncbi:MAG: flagellar biosynthesis protein FliQ [Firmicutes bacterium]|nr:flagellar biosynthesis protein FliQ [Bacillota bacterium]